MLEVKPSERPPTIRYVIRNAQGFYYDGHGYGPTMSASGEYFEPVGEAGVPGFSTRNILFAIKYGDTQSIEAMIKDFKKWCIDHNREAVLDMFDTCEVLETYT